MAGNLAHIRLVLIPAVITIGLTMTAVNEGHDAFKASCVVLGPITAFVLHLNLILVSIDDGLPGFY